MTPQADDLETYSKAVKRRAAVDLERANSQINAFWNHPDATGTR